MYLFPRAAVTHYQRTGGLKTTETYSLTILKAGSPMLRGWQGCAPSKSSWRTLPVLFQLTVAPGFLGLWPHNPNFSLCLHIPFSSSLCVFYKDTSFDLGATQIIQNDLILRSLMTSVKTLFPNEVISQAPGVRAQTYLFEEHHAAHCSHQLGSQCLLLVTPCRCTQTCVCSMQVSMSTLHSYAHPH